MRVIKQQRGKKFMANVIITNISANKEGNSEIYFSDVGEIEGAHTNEAPLKYLLECATKEDKKTTVIAIVTKEADHAYNYNERMLKQYCEVKNLGDLDFKKIDYEENFASVVSQIVENIKQDDKVYIEATGGFRKSVYILMVAVRILEYSGIKFKKAVYSIYNKFNISENHIEDISETYNMFNLISAANSFTSFGNSKDLSDFFKGRDNENIENIIKVMKEFSDEVALCRTSKLKDCLERLNESLNSFESRNSTSKNAAEEEILFGSIVGVIRSKFQTHGEGDIEYPDIINWCLDNNMIQQAITIYVEKIPEYFIKNGLIDYTGKLREIDKNFDEYYNTFYKGFLFLSSKGTVDNMVNRLKDGENSLLYELILNCRNIDHIKKGLSEDELKWIQNYITIRDILYNDEGKKRDVVEINKRKETESSKLKFCYDTTIFEEKANKVNGFMNNLLNNKKYIIMLQGNGDTANSYEGIEVIENLEHVLKDNNDICRVKDTVNLETLQNVLARSIYLKKFVRNNINHASENEQVDEDYKKYFEKKGYKVNVDDITADYIVELIKDNIRDIRTFA